HPRLSGPMAAAARTALAAIILAALLAPADAAEPERLTPQPPPTPALQSWAAAAPRSGEDKPPPALVPLPASPPRPAVPMSPPSQKAGQGGDAAPIAAAAAPGTATTAPVETALPGQPPAAKPAPDTKPKPTAKKPERVIRYAATEINVRPRPSSGARRSDVIDEGTALEVIGPLIDDKWVKVARHGEILGYVVADYLLPHPPKPH
ncbi:MAG: SH3 domain-containing protein, partial [Rhodospirillaceae bacterium]